MTSFVVFVSLPSICRERRVAGEGPWTVHNVKCILPLNPSKSDSSLPINSASSPLDSRVSLLHPPPVLYPLTTHRSHSNRASIDPSADTDSDRKVHTHPFRDPRRLASPPPLGTKVLASHLPFLSTGLPRTPHGLPHFGDSPSFTRRAASFSLPLHRHNVVIHALPQPIASNRYRTVVQLQHVRSPRRSEAG